MDKFVLLRHRDTPDIHKLPVYGEYTALKKAVTTMTPDQVINEVKASGLRGRGGAGFPAGVKWSFVPKDRLPHYVTVNADESEPGTFKDRELMEFNPHQVLEGAAIAAYAVGATRVYHYLRGEFKPVARKMQAALDEAYAAGYLGKSVFGTNVEIQMFVHLGAGAYICGEESALLESLEGRRGQPRLRPPFPAVVGLYSKPTVINNVETLTNVPLIVRNGAGWYRQFGTEKSPGLKIFSLSGRVNKPGNYELPLGTTFRQLIFEHGGGIIDGKQVKAIMSAGASSIIVPADDKALDCPMEYESTQQLLGAPLGSASIIVLDETVNIGWLVSKTAHFFKHESCGKCTPCREGTYWMDHITHRLVTGQGTLEDIDLLKNVALGIQGKCLCPLGEFSIMAVVSGIDEFREDFNALVKK